MRPLIQFVVLGAALFAADRLWWSAQVDPPVIRAASEQAVEDELLYREAIARGYERDDTVVFRRLVQNLRFAGAPDARDDASLFDEALALRLHETDPVARRRLVQRVRLDLEGAAPGDEPDDAALRAHYERDAAAYRSPARVRCTQLYFRADREPAAGALLAVLRADRTAHHRTEAIGDPFLHGAEQPLQTHDELAGRFGSAFADGVFAAPPGAWSGPIPSSYGVHLVFVHEREEPRALRFDEVRDTLRHEVIAEQRSAAFARGLRALRAGVRVVIETPAR